MKPKEEEKENETDDEDEDEDKKNDFIQDMDSLFDLFQGKTRHMKESLKLLKHQMLEIFKVIENNLQIIFLMIILKY